MKMYKFKPSAGETIGRARITQAALAERAGVNRTSLSTQLTTGKPMRVTTAAKIAAALADVEQSTPEAAFERLFEEFQQADNASD
jgi:DNA-binding XRE family transcriptional regulator